MKKALVFGGGGARGAYELGVWKALNAMHIKIDIVTGSSIGALNGAMYITDSYATAERLWYNLQPSQVLKTDKTDPKAAYAQFLKDAVSGGADTSPLEKMLREAIDEDKARKAPYSFGIYTCEFPSLKPLPLTLEQIPNGKLVDYLMASAAAYPTFKPKEIADKKYIDGGFYDNLPINFAIELGAKEVIAVDLQSLGLRRRTKDKSVIVDTIVPSRPLGSFLMFDKNLIVDNARLGFLDAFKFFGEYEGFVYTFAKGEMTKNAEELAFELRQLVTRIFQSKQNKFLSFAQLYSSRRLFKDVKNTHKIVYNHNIINLMRGFDILGREFDYDQLKVYTLREFCAALMKSVDEIINEYPEFDRDITEVDAKVNDVSERSNRILTCNILQSLVAYLDRGAPGFEVYTLFMLYPENSLAALTLYCVLSHYGAKLPKGEFAWGK